MRSASAEGDPAAPPERPAVSCDVLVVGSGLAGLMAAHAASEQGSSVAIVTAGELGADGDSTIASGGFAVAANTAAGDGPQHHLADTARSGAGLVAEGIASLVTRRAPAMLSVLERFGARFAKEPGGGYAFKPIPGHSYPRSVRCDGGGTAKVMAPLVTALDGVRVLDHHFVRRLCRSGPGDTGPVTGALATRTSDGADVVIGAAAVVLAAGGLGQLFQHTSNQRQIFGSGYALALQAGCSVADLEFVQFTPTALVHPGFAAGMSPGGALMAQPGVALRNTAGERFMRRYDPVNGECTTRDVLSRAIHREVVEGRGTEHGGVFLDLSGTSRTAIADISGRFLRAMDAGGFDPFDDMVEVAPEAHFCMGGVAVTEDGETETPGLYAAGEVTCGMHGANRLNSNALSEAAVTGHVAGTAAARHAAAAPSPGPFAVPQRRPAAASPAGVPDRVRRLMSEHVGVERHGEALRAAAGELERLATATAGAGSGADPVAAATAQQMSLVATVAAKAALTREESRGAHYRSDHPDRSAEQCAHNLFRLDADTGFAMTSVSPGEVPRYVRATRHHRSANP